MKPDLLLFKVLKDFTRKQLYGMLPTGEKIYFISNYKTGEVIKKRSYFDSIEIEQLIHEEKIIPV